MDDSTTWSSTKGLEVTDDAFQKNTTGSDFYLMTLAPNAASLLYATFFGGDRSPNHVDGGTSRFDRKGVVYQAACASCQNPGTPLSDFPTTANSVFPLNKSKRCSNAAFKFDMSLGEAQFSYLVDTCTAEFRFSNETKNYLRSYWDFGDGKSSEEDHPNHVYTQPGNYNVMLVANPGTQCADTVFQLIELKEDLRKIRIPNIFSPNGDGVNDEFEIAGLNAVCDQFEIWVYNRWGNLYFHSTDPRVRWDGRNETRQEAPDGVYYYIVSIRQYGGDSRYEQGSISIIR
jgi:gliding motility-associated-like protein